MKKLTAVLTATVLGVVLAIPNANARGRRDTGTSGNSGTAEQDAINRDAQERDAQDRSINSATPSDPNMERGTRGDSGTNMDSSAPAERRSDNPDYSTGAPGTPDQPGVSGSAGSSGSTENSGRMGNPGSPSGK